MHRSTVICVSVTKDFIMIISSINYKGGVGKSTVTQNLAVALALQGYNVCIVDADNTGATSTWADVRHEREVTPAIACVPLTNPKSFTSQVKTHYANYDVLIIDCPPALSAVAVKAMYVSHYLVIPVNTTGGSDVWVTEKLLERFQEIRDAKADEGVSLRAVLLPNQFRNKVTLHTLSLDILKELATTYEVGIFETYLGNRVAYGEANVSGLGVLEGNDPRAKYEIQRLTAEVINLATSESVT